MIPWHESLSSNIYIPTNFDSWKIGKSILIGLPVKNCKLKRSNCIYSLLCPTSLFSDMTFVWEIIWGNIYIYTKKITCDRMVYNQKWTCFFLILDNFLSSNLLGKFLIIFQLSLKKKSVQISSDVRFCDEEFRTIKDC